VVCKSYILSATLKYNVTVLFLDAELARKKTFKGSVFPLELPSLQIQILYSEDNRDRCRCRIDLQSITLALDSTIYIKLLFFSIMLHINKKGYVNFFLGPMGDVNVARDDTSKQSVVRPSSFMVCWINYQQENAKGSPLQNSTLSSGSGTLKSKGQVHSIVYSTLPLGSGKLKRYFWTYCK
jgi:hypothetical protein